MTSGKRLRILAVAEAANPEWTSVPLVGWSLAHALREVADVHIVTQVRNRDAILRAGLREGIDFTAIDSEAIARPVHRASELLRMGKGKGWTITTALSSRLAYPHFERLVWRQFRDRLVAREFDLVHRITPLTPAANSSLAARCKRIGLPFVLGPINGGVPWPPGFNAERWREREWWSYARGLYKFSPARRRMMQSCTAIIAGSRIAEGELPVSCAGKTTRIPENGVDLSRFNLRAAQPGTLPLRGCFVGRLVPLKGVDILIEAATPLLRDGRLKLDLVGSGPLESSLRELVDREGLQDAVTFHGWLAHAEVQCVLAQAQLLTFPSIREFGGGVVLEAMAMGVVPMVCDYAGPAELVTSKTGIKVPIGSRAEVVASFRSALHRVVEDPGILSGMADKARAEIEARYTWQRKAQQIIEVYKWALAPNGPIPAPFGQAQ